MKGSLGKWLPALAPGAVLLLLGIQVFLGLRGFDRPHGGVLGLLELPGILVGWGSIALLLPMLVWLLLGWWGYGLTGMALKAMGSVALGVSFGAIVGLGSGEAGGGAIGGALAALLGDTLGTFLAVVLLLVMAVPGVLLAAARFTLGPAPAPPPEEEEEEPEPAPARSPVPSPALAAPVLISSRVTPWYPKPRYDAEGNELPMDFGKAKDVGSIRFREEPSAAAVVSSVKPAPPPPAPEPVAIEAEDLREEDVEDDEADEEQDAAVESEPEPALASEPEPAVATVGVGNDVEDEPEPPTVASLLGGFREQPKPTDERRRLPPGVRYADEPPEPEPPPDEDSPFLDRGALARAAAAAKSSSEAARADVPIDEDDASREPRSAREWLEGASAAARNGRGAPFQEAPTSRESVSRAMEPLGREESNTRYRDKLAASGMFDGAVPVGSPVADAKPARKPAPQAAAPEAPAAPPPKKRATAKEKKAPPHKARKVEAAPPKPAAKTAPEAPRRPAKDPKAKAPAPPPAKEQSQQSQGTLQLRSSGKPGKAPLQSLPQKPSPQKAPLKRPPSQQPRAEAPRWAADRGDPLFVKAVEAALDRGAASPVLLTRRLGIGYARAKTLMDRMVETGVLGEVMASGARPTRLSREDWERDARPS